MYIIVYIYNIYIYIYNFDIHIQVNNAFPASYSTPFQELSPKNLQEIQASVTSSTGDGGEGDPAETPGVVSWRLMGGELRGESIHG